MARRINIPKGLLARRSGRSPGRRHDRNLYSYDRFVRPFARTDRARYRGLRQACAVPLGIDDTTSFLVEFQSGPTGYIGGTIAAPDMSCLNIYGVAASIYAGIDEEQVTLHSALGQREELQIEPVEPAETLRLELEEFARACAGDGSFRIDPEDALRNIAVMEAAITAARSGSATKVETV